MKILVAVVALVFVISSVAASHEVVEAVMMKYFDECMEANEANKEELEDLRLNKTMPADVSVNFKCGAKCTLDKYDVIDTDTGELLPEEFKARFTDEMSGDELDELIEACKEPKGENPCDTAFMIAFCMMRYRD